MRCSFVPDRVLVNAPGYAACAKCKIWYKNHGDKGLGYAYEVAWSDRQSKWYLLGEMETSHIQRIIGNLLLRPDWRENYRKVMLDELERRLSEEDHGTPT